MVRREKADRLRRYVHLSTGNYNPQTARLYTDLGLLTANREIGEDVTSLFNLLTAYSAPDRWNRLVAAPLGLHESVLGLIARGMTNPEIAAQLFLSNHTVKTHISRIFAKTGSRDRAAAIGYAHRHNIG